MPVLPTNSMRAVVVPARPGVHFDAILASARDRALHMRDRRGEGNGEGRELLAQVVRAAGLFEFRGAGQGLRDVGGCEALDDSVRQRGCGKALLCPQAEGN